MDRKFKVDAKAVLTLGRNSIKDATTAVVELVKNSYDADASVVDLVINETHPEKGLIRISDNGHGMSEGDVESSWLRVGFSEKVSRTISQKFKRRKTGEKGIGRLSADRLGEILYLRTKRTSADPIGLKVDWREFEVPGREIGEITFQQLADANPGIPKRAGERHSSSGTELTITRLRQQWTPDDIDRLHTELSLLLPPYPEIAKTFQIRFRSDVSPMHNGVILYRKKAKGEIELEAKLSVDGKLKYKLSYPDPRNRKKRLQSRGTVDWSGVAPNTKRRGVSSPYRLGKISIRLSFFVRRSDLLEGSGLDLGQLRKYLEKNVGVRIYRDLVRVKPYGDPDSKESDWLGLGHRKTSDPAGARRRSFKIAPNQLVGAVFAGRDLSPELVDSSSREGLIENDAFKQLRTVVMRCVNLIEAKYHELSSERPVTGSKAGRARATVRELAGNLSSLTTELSDLKSRVSGDLEHDIASVAEQIGLVIEQAAAARKEIDDLADQNTVFRGLATVGIASAIFGHETATAVVQVDGKIRNAERYLLQVPPNVSRATIKLSEAVGHLEKIESWGKFALLRVHRDKRRRTKSSITTLVNKLVKELKGPMAASDVDLDVANSVEVEVKTFPMDVEAILINLVTNAYQEVKRYSGERVVRVSVGKRRRAGNDGFELAVWDNGRGIPDEHAAIIWEPLFSTRTDDRGKPNGTGLGLAIVKASVEELDGVISVEKGPLGGAKFVAWFPGVVS